MQGRRAIIVQKLCYKRRYPKVRKEKEYVVGIGKCMGGGGSGGGGGPWTRPSVERGGRRGPRSLGVDLLGRTY